MSFLLRFTPLLLCLLLIDFTGYAQQFPIRSYSIEDGLSQSVVTAITQSADGYLWIGTEYGISRYDGFQFDNFHSDDGLASNNILYLTNTPTDSLLVATSSGVSVFDGVGFQAWNRARFAADFPITKISFSDEDFWLATDGHGLYQKTSAGEITHYDETQGLPSNRVHDLLPDEHGGLWIATHQGLAYLADGTLETLEETRDIHIHVLSYTANGNVISGTEEGLIFIRLADETLSAQFFTVDDGLADNTIRSLTLDHENGLWIGTENGISYYKDDEIQNYSELQGLSNTIVISGFLDREQMMWFGTYGGGINVFPGRYAELFTTDHGLSNNVITSFAELDDGRIWTATFGGGITEFNEDGKRIIRREQGLTDNRVFTLFKDSRSRIWIGTQSGISRYQNGEFVTIDESDAVTGGKVRAIRETQDGSFWIGTYGNGAVRFSNDGITRYNTENSLPNDIVMNILESRNGDIHLATYGGLVTKSNNNFEVLDVERGLTHNSVIHLYEDENEILWISTFRGITMLKNGEIRTITVSDGMPDNVCYFVNQDEFGNYWVGTNRGLTRLRFDGNPMTSNFALETFTTESMMVSNEANSGAVFTDSSNRMWIGTVGGITRITPRLLPEPSGPPLVHMRHVQVFDRYYHPNTELRLKHDENFIAFSFTAISLRAPSQIRFEYRLRGVDSGWNQTRQREARYTTLPHGNHTFEVRAFDHHGQQAPVTASVQFQIAPPFWLQTWFILLVISALLGLIYLIYYNYKVSKQVDLERVRIRIASDLHDDVGASLSEIALQTDLLQAISPPGDLQDTVAQIGELSRNIVTTMDDIVWSIDARNDSAGDLTDRIQDYATAVLLSRNIGVSYDFSGTENELRLPVEVRQNLYLIYKEAVNNIAKHANANQVEISLNMNGDHFLMSIKDDGSGEIRNRPGGQGLKNMKMRAARIGASFRMYNENGTTIEIKK